jgi:hypothetical protein
MNPRTVLNEQMAVSEKRLTVPLEVCPLGGPVLVVTTYSDGTRQVKLEDARVEVCDWA